jgi:hypothetical protein
MDIKNFSEKSQDYLSGIFSKASFNPNNNQELGIVKEPVKLGSIDFQLYFSNKLMGYEPNKQCQIPILFTFFLLVPSSTVKEKFLSEVNKKKSGQQYDEKIIAEYYSSVFPERVDVKEIINGMANMLETGIFPGKSYHFAFHLACSTADDNFAFIFLETDSVTKIGEKYKGEVPFEF